jgi:hypothetical protein
MVDVKIPAATAMIFALIAAIAGPTNAQESDSLVVPRASVCIEIEDHEPVGADTVFSKDVGRLYCFTQIEGAQDTTIVEHVWYYNGEERARVGLMVKAPRWRTWSSKKIMEDWTGPWTVQVFSAEGDLLKKLEFRVK